MLGMFALLASCSHRPNGKWSYEKVKVNVGDTINSLALKYRTDRLNIVKANPSLVKTGLKVGRWIHIPIFQYYSQKRSTIASVQQNSPAMHSAKSKVKLNHPIRGRITSPFGMRNGRPHHGIDIGAPRGTDIAAAATGKVVFVGWQRGYGKTVILSHNKGRYKTLYAHLSKISVDNGSQVYVGSKIGDVGTTGRSTGPHLHFELRDKRDIPVNPLKYLPRKQAPKKQFLFGSL
jgi:murein DD-endopeptidase MepM/ murein hydrolase activator NlpD